MEQHIELPAGTIHYETYGDGEPVVFVHGFAVDGRLWEPVAHLLAARGLRCIVPTWPFGSHTTPMNPDADLAPPAAARLVRDFLDALDLEGVTIVGNDSGGAVTQMLVTTDASRVGRLVLTDCDSFENFPPGSFDTFSRLARIPGVPVVLAQMLRSDLFLRSSLGFGALTAQRLPIELVRSWAAPMITDPAVRRDAMKYFTGSDRKDTLAAGAELAGVDLPALVIWGEEDLLFPLSDAERLRDALPHAELVTVPGASTFVSLDRPEVVAEAIATFVATRPIGSRS